MMFLRLVQVCLILALCSSSSGFSCRWISHKFGDLHGQYLRLLREMQTELSVDSTEEYNFDSHWFKWFLQQRHSEQPQRQVRLVVEVLEQISELLNEADSIYWNEKQMGNLLSTLERQTEGLRSCVTPSIRKNKRLASYFNQLRNLTQNPTVSTWEQIRKELLKVLSLLEFLPALSATEFTN